MAIDSSEEGVASDLNGWRSLGPVIASQRRLPRSYTLVAKNAVAKSVVIGPGMGLLAAILFGIGLIGGLTPS